ncbi:MAG: hypothetical protein AMXMBFR42_10630 [Burkholderiales bacterium]
MVHPRAEFFLSSPAAITDAAALDLLLAERVHMLWRSTALCHFHWGCAKTMERYARH